MDSLSITFCFVALTPGVVRHVEQYRVPNGHVVAIHERECQRYFLFRSPREDHMVVTDGRGYITKVQVHGRD